MSARVKHFSSTRQHALREERHFALVDDLAFPTLGSLVIVFRSGTQSDPCISSVATSIMITTSDSPVKGSGMPNQLLGVRLHTLAISRLSRVRTELSQLLIIPSLAPHPVQANGEFPRHRDFGDLPSPPQRQVKVLTAPCRQAAHCDLRRFHQQETQYRPPLLGDVSEPSPIAAGVFQRH